MGFRHGRDPPIIEPCAMVSFEDFPTRASNPNRLPATIFTVIKGPTAGATTALVGDGHSLDEISLHGMPGDNARGLGEITRVTGKKRFVVDVDLNVTMISRSRSKRRAIL